MSILEYTLLALLFLATFFAYLQYKGAQNQIQKDRQRSKGYTEVSLLYLKVLAREIGNELMQRDSKHFANHLLDLNVEWAEIEKDKRLLQATHEQLTSKYPMFEDFDVVDCWDYVIVGEALGGTTNEELWRIYRDIKIFAATLHAIHEIYLDSPITIERGLCNEYVGKIDRSRLLSELTTAEEVFNTLRYNGVDFDEDGKIESTQFIFYALEHVAEIRIGVHIKKTKQYGIIGKFYGGDDADYKSYYLSDASFEEAGPYVDNFFQDYMSTRKELNSIQRL